MKRIAVLGSGLLGGSIALAVQSRLPSVSVALWGRREQGIVDAKDQGIDVASVNLYVRLSSISVFTFFDLINLYSSGYLSFIVCL